MDQGYENEDDQEEKEEEVEVPSLERAWTHTVRGRLRSGDKRESRLHRRGASVTTQAEEEEEDEEEEEEIEEKEEEEEAETPSLERAWTHTVIGRLRSGDREKRLHRRGAECPTQQGEEEEEEEEEIEEKEEETEDFESMKYRELQRVCKARGISSRGKKRN